MDPRDFRSAQAQSRVGWSASLYEYINKCTLTDRERKMRYFPFVYGVILNFLAALPLASEHRFSVN
jgi:hypothetical protein